MAHRMDKGLKEVFKRFVNRMATKVFRALLERRGSHLRVPIKDIIDGGDPKEVDQAIGSVITKMYEDRDKLPSVTAVYRIKNASVYLEASILSIMPLCKKIRIIDNGSTDVDIDEYFEGLKKKYGHISEFELLKYPVKLTLPGKDYQSRLKANKEGSLADYYNFAFKDIDTEYAYKVDAHKLVLPDGILSIQNALASQPKAIIYSGQEIYGRPMSREVYLFRTDLNLKYVDGDQWEYLDYSQDVWDEAIEIYRPTFIHIKSLNYNAYAYSKISQETLYK